MKIRTWSSGPIQKEVDVEFPAYSQWGGDTFHTFNRLEANGTVLSITKNTGHYDEGFLEPGFEFSRRKTSLDPLDESYIGDGIRSCTADEFEKVCSELSQAVAALK